MQFLPVRWRAVRPLSPGGCFLMRAIVLIDGQNLVMTYPRPPARISAMVIPPSSARFAPVTKADSSLAR